jgi:hypothetical protein
MLVAAALMLFEASAQAQTGNGNAPANPFLDHADTGEIIHVLPPPASIRSPHDTQPTDAPPSKGTAVYPASYGSGNLIDHGGLEIPNAGFIAIYWNSGVANSTATSLGYATVEAQVGAFVSGFSDNANWDNSTTDDYTIVQQYGSTEPIASTFQYRLAFVDSQPTKSSIKDSSIRSYLAGLFNASKLPVSSDTVYGVYFPAGMKILLSGGGSCSSFCGYHSHFTYGSYQIKYAVFPYPNCTGCSLSGKSVADMLTIISSHEIREAVTDPDDGNTNAWYDASGYEADDKCVWHNLYQMTSGGFWVQPEYSNGGAISGSGFTATYPGPGCVVPNR